MYENGQRESDLIDLSVVDSVPVSLIAGTEDTTAPPEHAEEIFEMLGYTEKYIYIEEGWDHFDFETAGRDPSFIDRLVSTIEYGHPYNEYEGDSDDDSDDDSADSEDSDDSDYSDDSDEEDSDDGDSVDEKDRDDLFDGISWFSDSATTTTTAGALTILAATIQLSLF